MIMQGPSKTPIKQNYLGLNESLYKLREKDR